MSPAAEGVLGKRGMVCASQPQAAAIGLDVLAAGGHAVDAAIAVNAAQGLMEPTGCGVGGDLFAMLWDAQAGQLVGLDGSGRSAKSLSVAEMRRRCRALGEPGIPGRHGLAVSVPGCVDGWIRMHERFGRFPLGELLAPAMAAAREGFELTPVIATTWRRAETTFAGNPDFAALWLPGGRAPTAGESFTNPDLAETYELIAREGRRGFYEGELARHMVVAVQAAGGGLDLDDFAQHRSSWVTPLSARYREHELWELPPAGQGLAALQMLRLLDGFDLAGVADGMGPLAPAVLHLLVEAKRLAFADRARHYGDPNFWPPGSPPPAAALLSDAYTDARRALIDTRRAAQHVQPGDPAVLSAGDTICLSVADAEGNLVSWIQSNYEGFGSGIVPRGSGFGLQNRGRLFHLDLEADDQAVDPHPNAYEPGKRPFHTIIPAMVTKAGEPVLCFGLMGGDIQPQGHVQVLSHMLDFGLDVEAAGAMPRWRHEGRMAPTGLPSAASAASAAHATGGDVLFVEDGIDDATIEALRAYGHDVRRDSDTLMFGGFQAIAVETGPDGSRRYRGASEVRKDGRPLAR